MMMISGIYRVAIQVQSGSFAWLLHWRLEVAKNAHTENGLITGVSESERKQMYRKFALSLARSRWKVCVCNPPHILPGSSPDFPPAPVSTCSRRQYASRGRGGGRGRGGRGGGGRGGGSGGGRGGASGGRREDSDDDNYDHADGDDGEEDEDEDEDSDEEVETPGYEFDYDTWNLLHQGKKEGEASRKWPLPMYKAREMVDYHIMKNRLDGLKVITDPKMEYNLRKQLHEGLVDLYKKTQAAYDEIEARVQANKQKTEFLQVTEGDPKIEDTETEVLQVTEGDTKIEDSELQNSGEGASDVKVVEGGSSLQVSEEEINVVESTVEEESKDEEIKLVKSTVVEGSKDGEINLVESSVVESKDVAAASISNAGEEFQEEGSAEGRDLSVINTAVDEAIKDVMSVPELTTLELAKEMMVVETKVEGVEDDGVNVFDYDKWVAYREQQIEKRYADEEERKHATLRWKIQLVLGPGDVVHPANRKASVSVYVRELCLSKYAKQRLLALVGKRYNSPKDELTIVSERFPHRYENQKDVLRLLLALIEEAKKADQFVYDARIGYLKVKNAELKKTATSVAAI
ncbi:hypothetical protein L7F22_002701 [Adiantum nelumboides]|nr:hypothetical protein [Adiantum nelumboides]